MKLLGLFLFIGFFAGMPVLLLQLIVLPQLQIIQHQYETADLQAQSIVSAR